MVRNFPDTSRVCSALFAAGLALLAGCLRIDPGREQGDGSSNPGSGGGGAGGQPVTGTDAAVDKAPAPCVNLECQRPVCPAGTATTISGTTFAPNGKLPLYNVQVYVPNAPLAPLAEGVSCDRCVANSGYVAAAASDEHGHFRLTDVPAGKDIPLVLQVGKWRRKVTLANVTACQDNVISDADLTRLPRNRQEGDMPRIAVTTGSCDSLGCLLPKVGVDAAELGAAGENKAVTFFKGGGIVGANGGFGPANMTSAMEMWTKEAELSKFDMTLLSCECSEQPTGKGPMAYDAMARYLAKGGRIFGTDFMYVWYRYSPDMPLAGALQIQGGAPAGKNPLVIDTSFAKGKALADWMKFVDPAVTYGEIQAEQVFDNFTGAMMPTTQVWASSANTRNPMPHPRIVSINTPAGASAEQQCGRAVHLDAHIAVVSVITTPGGTGKFPEACGTELNKGEQALAFLFFDLAACLPVIIP